MTTKQLKTHYNAYIKLQMGKDAIISVSGFKKYLMITKKLNITDVIATEGWSGVRGNLDILYEDYLVEKASAGGRNSQTYTQLLNKFYDKQARRGADVPVVTVKFDFANDGANKIGGDNG